MTDDDIRQHEDREWNRLQVQLAENARHKAERRICNTALRLVDLLALVGKINAAPIGRYPAGQVMMTSVFLGPEWTPDGGHKLAFFARLEYSPLGWPESTSEDWLRHKAAPESADLNVLFEEGKASGRREFL